MAIEGAKAQEGGSDRPLVLVLNASPATSFEEEVGNSPEALIALRNKVDIKALSQLLQVWWIAGAEEGDLTEIGLDDVTGLKRKYSNVQGLELFALCLSAVLDDPDSNQLHEELLQKYEPGTRIVLLRDASDASTQSVLFVFASKTAQNVRRLLKLGQKSQDEEDIKEEADDETIDDEDKTADRPVQIIFVVDSANEEVNGQEGTIELIRPRFEIDLERRQILAENLLTPEDAHAERAWEQVTREIASFGLPLVQDFRNHVSIQLDEERDRELDEEKEKPALMCAKLHVDSDAFQEQIALRQQIGMPQPDVAHPEQREVAKEVFCKAEKALFGTSNADWTSKFNSVSFVVLTPNFNSLQSQTANRVTRAKLEGGRVLKHTKVPHAAMDAHREWMEEEAKNLKTLFVIIADECHFAPTKDGAHDWLLNNPALDGENVLRLLVSATPQNVLSKTSRVANTNIVHWSKPASMYRSMDYYVETATWAVPNYVRPLRLAVKGENYDVDPRVFTHEGCAYRYPMHDYKAFCSVFNRRVHKELGPSLANELISVQGGKENLLLVVPRDVDLDFDENFDKKTGLLYWLGFNKYRAEFEEVRTNATKDGRNKYYRIGDKDPPKNVEKDIEKDGEKHVERDGEKESKICAPRFCDTDGKNNAVDCLPRRRQRVLKDEAFDVVRGLANRSFGKRGAAKRKQKGNRVAESTPLYDGHIIMADYLLSLTYLAVYRIDHGNLWVKDDRSDIFAPLEKNGVRRLALDDEKLKAFALHLGFADRVWAGVAHETDKEVGCFKIADGVEEASVQHLLKVLLEAIVRSAWSELSDLIDENKWQKTLTGRLDREWVEEAKSLAIAENHDTPTHWRIAWQYVVSEKLERNREDRTESQGNTSQSWYNETDRLLHDLLDVDPKYRTGRMAVVRVYETDENLSIQDCLRSALKKLGLTSHDHGGLLSVVADVGGSDGKKRTSEGQEVQKVARRATSLFTQLEPWALTRDLRHPSKQKEAETEGETIVDRVNKSFAEAQAQEAEARKHLGEASRSSPSKAVQKTAKYEDLENLPTIVILCEKGRMGDTFPHSFRFLDIRLRSSKTYSTFVQEFGRVCRYPGLDDSSAVTFVLSEEKGWTALEHQLEQFFKDPEVRRYFAKGGSYAVLDPGGEVRFHADSELQLKSSFQKAWDKRDDGRARFGTWTAKRYVHVLPTVLMNAERYNAQLQKAIEHKYRDAEGRQRIDQCIPGPLDLYLSSGPRRAAAESRPRVEINEKGEQKVKNPMHGIEAYRLRSAQTSRQATHYDSERSDGHDSKRSDGHDSKRSDGDDPRRLLLMAQCQQGKTGTYLHFLRLLKERVEIAIPTPPDALPLVPRAEWTLPHWRNLIVSAQSPGFPALRSSYAMPKKGQYHASVLQQRTLALMLASENGSGWYEAYCGYLFGEDGEAIVSRAGLDKIEVLSRTVEELGAPFDGSRCTNSQLALDCVNFDGRFSSAEGDALAKSFLESKHNTAQLRDILDKHAKNSGTSLGHRVRIAREHVQRQLWDAGSRRGRMDQPKDGGADSFTQSETAANAYESVAARSTLSGFTDKHHRKQYMVKDVKLVDEGVCLSVPYAGFHGLNLEEDGRNMRIKVGEHKLLNVSPSSETRHTMRTLDDATSVRWVFVPSYNRAGVALVDYEKAIPRDDRGKPTIVCIVVRSGKQFDDYVAAYGSAHIILSLPASMASKTLEGSRVFAERGGIGYARLFVQLAAHQLGLPWVWILDDNVDVCYERKLADKVPANALSAHPDACTFSTVMIGVESIVHNEDEELAEAHNQKRLEKWKPDGPVLRKRPAPELSNENARTKEELTAGADQYGLIGIRRDPRARQTESEHPFMVTYSVYSFIYLNVTSTVNAEVFFPVKTFWEDVEFNHLVDEAGLVCLKVNRFFHHKKNLKLSARKIREHTADDVSPQEFANLTEALDHFGKLNGGLRPAPLWSNLVPDRFEQGKRWAAEFWDRISGKADVRPSNALLTCFLEVSQDDANNRIVLRTAGELSNLLLVVREEDIGAFSEIADADDGINLLGGNRQLKIYHKARFVSATSFGALQSVDILPSGDNIINTLPSTLAKVYAVRNRIKGVSC
ncbi:GREB1-like protein [Hondaea fermentalgiana]|uniref:GREB1-like protein n=1 Tax=Hondaea fermentalgiana TaxID=2315210 RepID=A0A2R5H028_9STRA|nr:GREB1-like protein [Hondaea fermentalgiana]|eukprot:GBG34091.1 GREB1-like protein [Hondaea fermentalgiana]